MRRRILTVLLSLALVLLGFWILLHLDFRRRWPEALRLDPSPAPIVPEGGVAAIIPARDEAEMLPAALPSVLNQKVAGLQVILVDDDSSDGTAELAERLGKGDPSLTVLRKRVRPEGWAGKVAALQAGVEHLSENEGSLPTWLLFTDADIQHRENSIAALLAKAEEEEADMVSVMARLDVSGFWARLLIPPFLWFFHLLYPFRLVRDPRSSVAAAAGGCLLVRSAALLRAGGLEAIKDAIIDDVSIGRVLKRSGAKLWLGFDPGIVSLRPYTTLDPLWRMVARSAFVQLRYSYLLLLLTLVGLGFFFVSPPLLLSLALGLGDLPAAAACAGVLVLQSLALYPAVRWQTVPWPYALLLPLGSLLYAAMTFASAWNHARGHGNPWKARSAAT